MQTLIIITGHSAAGKTVLSHRIASHFSLLCINKDDIKETIGDEFGAANRDESRRIGKATYGVMDRLIERSLSVGLSLIVESNFPAHFYNDKIAVLKEKYDFQIIQIVCKADPEVLRQRTIARIENGTRHPVHCATVEAHGEGYLAYLGDGRLEPLNVGGETIELDTTDFSKVDYEELMGRLEGLLNSKLDRKLPS